MRVSKFVYSEWLLNFISIIANGVAVLSKTVDSWDNNKFNDLMVTLDTCSLIIKKML